LPRVGDRMTWRTLEQIREALRDSLHPRIPVDDYMNEMYSARPIADFDIDGEHEIPGVYSVTGNPIVCEIDINGCEI